MGQRAHVFKHFRGRCIIGPFENIYHKGTLWRGSRAIIYFILRKLIFINFHYKGDTFYDRYINTEEKNRYIDDDNTSIKSRHTSKNNSRGRLRGYGSNNKVSYFLQNLIKLLK